MDFLSKQVYLNLPERRKVNIEFGFALLTLAQ